MREKRIVVRITLHRSPYSVKTGITGLSPGLFRYLQRTSADVAGSVLIFTHPARGDIWRGGYFLTGIWFTAAFRYLSPSLQGSFSGGICKKAQIIAIEERYRAELERWKAEAAKAIRKDSVNRSRSTLKGMIAEQMAPVYPSFQYLPADARFIGSTVDYIVFDGLSEVANEHGTSLTLVFMNVEHGTATLTRTLRGIKKGG